LEFLLGVQETKSEQLKLVTRSCRGFSDASGGPGWPELAARVGVKETVELIVQS
jgi:hypothetical protein